MSGDNVERFLQADIPRTWKAMEAQYDSGKVRAIGVSNFSAKTLDGLLEVSRVVPAVNQVECHPMWQQPKLREYCKSKGIHLSVSFQYRRFVLHQQYCKDYDELIFSMS